MLPFVTNARVLEATSWRRGMLGLSGLGAARTWVVVSVVLLSAASLAGCSSDGTTGVADTGSIEVTTVTTGGSIDPDGYLARVFGRRQWIGVNAVVTITGLAPGDHDVELISLTSNCAVTGANPQTVTVVAGETASASFEVACESIDLEALGKIAYVRDNNVWVMEGHGGNPVGLTNAGDAYGPVWSPDGTRIAFTRGGFDDFGPPSDLWVMDADGSNPISLTTSQEAYEYSPVWSPDGTRIAFIRQAGNSELWVMDADGSNPVNLTNDPADDWNPAWSPDGTRIAFTRQAGNSEIWVMDADGSNPVDLTNDPADDGSPAWSPDGSKIAFARFTQTGNSEIWVMDADGSNPVPLTDTGDASGPVWSPDGTRIAFARFTQTGNSEIWVMDADGSNPVNLTNDPAEDYGPAWSSDGTTIAFTRFIQTGHSEIWVMGADGSNPVNLTNDATVFDLGPVWSPAAPRP